LFREEVLTGMPAVHEPQETTRTTPSAILQPYDLLRQHTEGTIRVSDLPALVGELEAMRARVWAELISPMPGRNGHPDNDEDRLLDVAEAAERLSLSADYLCRHSHEFPFTVREGNFLRFSSGGIDRYIRSRTAKG